MHRLNSSQYERTFRDHSSRKNIQKEDTKEHSEIIQVGISEHHSLVATSLKSQLVRQMKIGLPIKSKGISM